MNKSKIESYLNYLRMKSRKIGIKSVWYRTSERGLEDDYKIIMTDNWELSLIANMDELYHLFSKKTFYDYMIKLFVNEKNFRTRLADKNLYKKEFWKTGEKI